MGPESSTGTRRMVNDVHDSIHAKTAGTRIRTPLLIQPTPPPAVSIVTGRSRKVLARRLSDT